MSTALIIRRLMKSSSLFDHFATARRLITSVCKPSTRGRIESTASVNRSRASRVRERGAVAPPAPLPSKTQSELNADAWSEIVIETIESQCDATLTFWKGGIVWRHSVPSGMGSEQPIELYMQRRVDELWNKKATRNGVSSVTLPIMLSNTPARSFPAARMGLTFTTALGGSPPRLSKSIRLMSTTASKHSDNLAHSYGLEKPVPLDRIMSDLRHLQLLEQLRGTKPRSATGYKDAIRALYPLWHAVEQSGGEKVVTLNEVMDYLPLLYSVPWTSIRQILTQKKDDKLRSMSQEEKACAQFMRIYNVGPARARAFYSAGARTIDGLLKMHDAGKIKLIRSQIIGIQLLDDFERLIPRSEMDELKAEIIDVLHSVQVKPRGRATSSTSETGPFEAELLGSYRRGLDFASDLDLAVRHPAFKDNDDLATAKNLLSRIITALQDRGLINYDYMLAQGEKKFMGMVKLPSGAHHRRIDIRLGPYDSYPYMVLGGSGDALLMKLMRYRAKQRGMCLNEYGMGDKFDAFDQNPNGFRPETLRVVKNEQEIFELLDLPYLEPKEREFSYWKDKYLKAEVDLSPIVKL